MRLSKLFMSVSHYLYLHGDKNVTGISENIEDTVSKYTFYLQDVHLTEEERSTELGTDFLVVTDDNHQNRNQVACCVIKEKALDTITYDREEVLQKVADMITTAALQNKKNVYVCVSTKKIRYRNIVDSIILVLVGICLLLLGRLG